LAIVGRRKHAGHGDLMVKYKETARSGLAVGVIEC
jgi:hypothetical protein